MKREDWQRVYQPRAGALEGRVKRTLDALDAPDERSVWKMKKAMTLALAMGLLLAAAAALAAGVMFSEKMDVKTAARQTLTEQYGFTPAMEGFFECRVSEPGDTVTFAPMEGVGAGIERRLGTYTVTIGEKRQAKASWSHDGETIGRDTSSPVWDTTLLAEAIERKAAGEEWVDIVLDEVQTAVNITPEQAVDLAREAVAAQFGAQALEGCVADEPHLFIRGVEMAEDGSDARCYQVRFGEKNGRRDRYDVKIGASRGGTLECTELKDDGGEAEVWSPVKQEDSAEAKARATITEEQAVRLAKDAVAETYSLSADQMAHMERVEGRGDALYLMRENVPVMRIWFWTWGEEGAFAEGDGMYSVDVNVEDGTIENILYDSTLGGNG